MLNAVLLFYLLLPSSLSLGGKSSLSDVCNCDLTSNECDVNCCCDADCSETDKKIFSSCKEDSNIIKSDRYCLHKNAIIFKNVEFKTEMTKNDLFCIYYDNYKEKFLYQNPEILSTDDKYDDYINLYFNGKKFLAYPSIETPAKLKDFYSLGDSIFAIAKNGALIRLPLPQGIYTDYCNYQIPAEYFVNKQTKCFYRVVDIEHKCESDPILSPEWYSERFKIIRKPKDATIFFKKTEKPDALAVVVSFANTSESSRPTYNNVSKVCLNVVKSVYYVVTINAILEIVKIEAKFGFGTILKSVAAFQQKFSIEFHWQNEGNDTFQRSGNTGYIIGEPVMAGEYVAYNDSVKILKAENRNEWLTVIKSNQAGLCNSSSRAPITFGENILTGCFIEVLSSTNCRQLQEEILSILKGPTRDRIGMYANASVDNVGDWLTILHENEPPLADTTSDQSCSNVISGVNIEILHAKTGSFQNPQSKIIGIRYKYRRLQQTITSSYIDCLTTTCINEERTANQRIQVMTTVTFIDVTEPAQPAIAAIPTINVKLPNDFFYPFFTSTASHKSKIGKAVTVASILLACTFSSSR